MIDVVYLRLPILHPKFHIPLLNILINKVSTIQLGKLVDSSILEIGLFCHFSLFKLKHRPKIYIFKWKEDVE